MDTGDVDAVTAGALDAATPASRPWSIAAAMEPVPPLAPPPALPGRGVAMATSPRPVAGLAGRSLVVVVLVALLLVAAVSALLVLVLGR